MSHAALSLMSFISGKRTLRLVLNTAISGRQIRLRLCNRYSSGAVSVGRASIALCDENGVIADPGSIRPILFGGREGLTLPPGKKAGREGAAFAVSDETEFAVPAGANLSLDLYIKRGRLNSGNYQNTARLLCARGSRCGQPTLRHRKRPRDLGIAIAAKLLGMTLHSPIPLFQALELYNCDGASSIECFGDSLTQQGFWSGVFEEKIRRLYPGRYSVISKAIAGNRILRDASPRMPLRGFFGTKALERVHEDILAFEGISHVILCHGTNDYLQPGTLAGRKSEYASAEEIAAGVSALAAMIRTKGVTLIGLNYVPTGLSPDATPEKNDMRRQLNEWFEQCGLFDYTFDVSSAFASRENPDLPVASYVGADRVHPSAEGGRAFAQAIDCGVFTPPAC